MDACCGSVHSDWCTRAFRELLEFVIVNLNVMWVAPRHSFTVEVESSVVKMLAKRITLYILRGSFFLDYQKSRGYRASAAVAQDFPIYFHESTPSEAPSVHGHVEL